MIILHLGVGVLVGAFCAAITLLLGSSVLWSLAVYSAAGMLGVVGSAVFAYARPKIADVMIASLDRTGDAAAQTSISVQYSDNKTAPQSIPRT